MESTLEQMKMLHAKLCMESLDQASQPNRKKKVINLLSYLHDHYYAIYLWGKCNKLSKLFLVGLSTDD